jgi:hypothetical protein
MLPQFGSIAIAPEDTADSSDLAMIPTSASANSWHSEAELGAGARVEDTRHHRRA